MSLGKSKIKLLSVKILVEKYKCVTTLSASLNGKIEIKKKIIKDKNLNLSK